MKIIFAHSLPLVVLGVLAASLFLSAEGRSQSTGTISGTVLDAQTREPLPLANVVIKETQRGTATDERGNFTIADLAPGSYTLVVSIVGHLTREIPGVSVSPLLTTTWTITLEDAAVQVNEVVVYGASFRKERITDAPAAVTALDPADIQLNAGQGQVPKLLETTPGVDIAQNGLYDFNVNTRGFNSSLTRRLLVLLDGRDLSIVFLGAQEWNGLSVPVEDLGRLEFVRGPGSALYGANAFNGVINIITPSPRQVLGTKATVAGGELSTFRTDIRHAGMSGPWSYKMNVGRFQGKTWSTPRDASLSRPFEYDGLNPFLNVEARPLNPDEVASTYGSGRVDYDIDEKSGATAEGGITQVENEVYITGIGRVQVTRALKPWGRVSYTDGHSSLQLWASGRDSREPQYSLSTGLPLEEHSLTLQGDYQYHFTALDDRLFVTTGLSYRSQRIDTRGTLMLNEHRDNMTGVYAQLEYRVAPQLKAVAAARFDRSTLHESQLSPKVALVYSPFANHTFRLTYNRAFQAPNYSELYLSLLHPAKLLAYYGNSALKVEKIGGLEFGYKGVLNASAFLTIDAYYNELSDFITDLSPGANPAYRGQELINGQLRTVWSYGNAGKVTETGAEVGANYYFTDAWSVGVNYAYFDFSIVEQSPGDPIQPNAPRHKMNTTLTYRGARFEGSVGVKVMPSFDWAAGIYQGRILAYTLVNLAASYRLTNQVQLALNVANLLDREHYEIFGGSLLRRRAIASTTVTF